MPNLEYLLAKDTVMASIQCDLSSGGFALTGLCEPCGPGF